MQSLSVKELESAKVSLSKLLINADMEKKSCYRPRDILKLLNISYPMFITMCDLWEPLEVKNRSNSGLESYRVGTHRRIPHHALVEWIAINKRLGD